MLKSQLGISGDQLLLRNYWVPSEKPPSNSQSSTTDFLSYNANEDNDDTDVMMTSNPVSNLYAEYGRGSSANLPIHTYMDRCICAFSWSRNIDLLRLCIYGTMFSHAISVWEMYVSGIFLLNPNDANGSPLIVIENQVFSYEGPIISQS